MIEPDIKRCIGQLVTGVQVVGAQHDGVRRLYTSHWVSQVSFEEPIVMASVSPKHDTHPIMTAAGEFAVSILAADQVSEAQYFGYPGHRLQRVADEYVEAWPGDPDGPPIVPGSIAWLRCETFQVTPLADHELFFARVVDVEAHRLRESPLLYSSRLGWRVTGERARRPDMQVRDRLLDRLHPPDRPSMG